MSLCVCLLGWAVSSEINKAQARDLPFSSVDRQVNRYIFTRVLVPGWGAWKCMGGCRWRGGTSESPLENPAVLPEGRWG